MAKNQQFVRFDKVDKSYDGKVLVVYYYSYPDGSCGIEGTVVEEVF